MKELNVTEMRAAEGGASVSFSDLFSLLTSTKFVSALSGFLTALATLISKWDTLKGYLS